MGPEQRIWGQERWREAGGEPPPFHAARRLRAPSGGTFDAPDTLGAALTKVLRSHRVNGVVYADAMDPRSLGLLTWSEDPAHFVTTVRPLFTQSTFLHVEFRCRLGTIPSAPLGAEWTVALNLATYLGG
jgi:hypothetical protein